MSFERNFCPIKKETLKTKKKRTNFVYTHGKKSPDYNVLGLKECS